ncbi:MAG: hypothetical protein ACYYK0_07545 [Candidatus Eutrophobiaceae bacterium]
MSSADILRSILDDKRQWVEERSRRAMPLAEIKARIDDSASLSKWAQLSGERA